ncbi:MAG: penicillin-binding protein 1C [Prevotellaceae bacterium]|jgi:penicillin-binding protein 1C|nr:penicillin-binding protein 1C [Prevotellaceae bacterium]
MTNRTKIILAGISVLLIVYVFCLPKHLFDVPYSTVVTDSKGELLGARIAADGQWRFPPCDTVPYELKTCLITFEDKHFYKHWGVNPLSVFRAIKQNVQSGRIVSGGSTVTMQVIRLSRNNRRTFGEKLIESVLATRLEFRYSKAHIIGLYASHAPFGGNVVGFQAAAWRYFGRSADKLSWAEAATLAVLPNSPSVLHLAKNRSGLQKKRDRLLRQLLKQEIIDKSTFEAAIDEPLPDKPMSLPQIAPHLTDRFVRTNKGEQIVSTIDKNIQLGVEARLERWSADFAQNDIKNMAAIIIDVKENKVIAYCGNVNYNDTQHGNQVDVIVSNRSPGSLLKPFLYYAMLDNGDILPDMLMPDVPMNAGGFIPQNFNMLFDGAVPASQAVSRSLNVPLVYMLRQYSVAKFYNFLKNYRIVDLPHPASHYGLPLILGGAEITLGSVTNAYSNMARSLEGLPPSNLIFEAEQKQIISKQKYNPAAVWQVFDAIKEVNRPEEIDWHTLPSMQKIAWKTGTSFGFRDAWAVGITPRFVVGVWAGNASGQGAAGLVGAKTAAPVMFDIFEMLPASKWFEMPSEQFVTAEICTLSGHLAGRFCEQTQTGFICPNGLKTESCKYHVNVSLSADERFRVYENCAGKNGVIQKKWFVLPPAWAWYYSAKHPEYKPLPPLAAGCGEDYDGRMQFIYPQNNAKIKIPRNMDGSRGEVTFEIAHNNKSETIFWHLDGEFIASTHDFHRLSLSPETGTHQLTAVDAQGNTISCKIVVED